MVDAELPPEAGQVDMNLGISGSSIAVRHTNRCDSRATRGLSEEICRFCRFPFPTHATPVCVRRRIALSLAPWDDEKCAALRSSSQ